MQILIFEGIATSGKSTVIQKILDSIGAFKDVLLVGESRTIMPIINNTEVVVSLRFLTSLLSETLTDKHDLVIYDRLHLTHIFRNNAAVDNCKTIEDFLLRHETTTVFLLIDESSIKSRIQKAAKYREKSWQNYINTKGQNPDEIAEYYITQQRHQLELLNKSRVPHKIFNSTKSDYDEIAVAILSTLEG